VIQDALTTALPVLRALGEATRVQIIGVFLDRGGAATVGEVQSADVRRAHQLADEVLARYGFVTDVGHLSLDGLCASCAAAVEERAGTKPAS